MTIANAKIKRLWNSHGTITAYGYIAKAVDVLAASAPVLAEAVMATSTKVFVSLDGTLLPVDGIAADRPFHSGKHTKQGMNVQVVADLFGRLLWASSALPGAVHDVRAAREHGVIGVLAGAGIVCWADKGYQGAKEPVARSVFPAGAGERRRSAGRQAVNRSDAKIRALIEQVVAALESWRLLHKLCLTTRIPSLVSECPHPPSGQLRVKTENAHERQRKTHSSRRIRVEHGIAHLKSWLPLARHLVRCEHASALAQAAAGLLSHQQACGPDISTAEANIKPRRHPRCFLPAVHELVAVGRHASHGVVERCFYGEGSQATSKVVPMPMPVIHSGTRS